MRLPENLSRGNTLLFAEAARARRAQGEHIYSLGLGEPYFDTPAHIRAAATQAIEGLETRYSGAAGLPELRTAIAASLSSARPEPLASEQVVVTAGAKAGLFIAAASLLRPGDEVINITPCYVSNHPILKLSEPDVVVRDIDLLPGSFRLDLDAIAAALTTKTKVIFFSFPNNPTGAVLHPDDLDALAALLDGSDAMILSDEIYAELTHGSAHVSPSAHTGLFQRTLVVGGPSKTHAMTGWRAGWIAAPSELAKPCIDINLQIQTCVPPFIQRAVLAALDGPNNHTKDFVTRIQKRIDRLDQMLIQPLELQRAPIGGGFFAFVNVGATSSDEFCAGLLQATGVAVIPGASFGSRYDGWVRISLAAADDEFETGLALMRDHMLETGQ